MFKKRSFKVDKGPKKWVIPFKPFAKKDLLSDDEDSEVSNSISTILVDESPIHEVEHLDDQISDFRVNIADSTLNILQLSPGSSVDNLPALTITTAPDQYLQPFPPFQTQDSVNDLADQLHYAEERIELLQLDNEKLILICEEGDLHQDQQNCSMIAMAQEIQQQRDDLYEGSRREKCLELDIIRLRRRLEEMEDDLSTFSSRFDHVKSQNVRQETDFDVFGRKIKSQQIAIQELEDENDGLKASLRRIQFEPILEPNSVLLQQRLERAVFEIEALKAIIVELEPNTLNTRPISAPLTRSQDTKDDVRLLTERKAILTHELSRIKPGFKAKTRENEIDQELELLDKELRVLLKTQGMYQ